MALRIPLRQSSFFLKNMCNFTKFISTRPEIIVLSNDCTTFVAWHPQIDFPYKCTQPIPSNITQETNTILKTEMSQELKQIFKTKTPDVARQELMNITHTTKHRWFPRARDKRAKKTEPDRKYL